MLRLSVNQSSWLPYRCFFEFPEMRPSGRQKSRPIQTRSLGKMTLCGRFRAGEAAGRGNVSAIRGCRSTSGSSLEEEQPRLRQKLLGKRRGGAMLIAAAKGFLRSYHAGNGGTKLRPGSVPAERFFPALARRATQIPTVRGPRRMPQNGSSTGPCVSLLVSNQVTCHSLLPEAVNIVFRKARGFHLSS